MKLAVLIAAAAALLAGATPASAAVAAVPPIGHVFTIVLENKDYGQTFGPDSSKAPYLAKDLVARGTLLANYYATGHFSLDNYLTMISGQSPNPFTQADCPRFTDVLAGIGCVYPASVKTVADQLDAKQLTWRGYMQDMGDDPAREAATCGRPAVGARDATQAAAAADQYATRHDPFVYFHSIIDDQARCDAGVVNLDRLEGDLASVDRTPNYAFITPDLCADGHDATCADAGQPGGYAGIDAFLREWVPKIEASPAFRQDGLLVITFDEAEHDSTACCDEPTGPSTLAPGQQGPGGGKVGAVLLGPYAKPGATVQTPVNHYGYLRSVEDVFGLGHLGYAAQAGLATFQSTGALTATRHAVPPTGGSPIRRFGVPKRFRGRRIGVRVRLATGVLGRITVRRGRKLVTRVAVRESVRMRVFVGRRGRRFKLSLRATRDGKTVARRTAISRRR